jgi:HEAT repeat protein
VKNDRKILFSHQGNFSSKGAQDFQVILSTRNSMKGIIMTNFHPILNFLTGMFIKHSKFLMSFAGFFNNLRKITALIPTKADVVWTGIFGLFLLCSPFTRDLAGQSLQQTHTDLVIESLNNAITDDDEEVREKAIQTLGKINSKKANEVLYEVLINSSERDVEVNIAKILLKRGEEKALDKFIKGLVQEDDEGRIRSARVLKELKHPASLNSLIKALNDPNYIVQKQALKAISEIRTVACIKPLVKQLQGENQEFRAIAAWGLGEIEDQATLPYLYKALKDPIASVRRNAIESIGDLKLAASVKNIQPLLSDEHWFVRQEAVKVLAEIKSKESVPLIIELLYDEQWKVRESAALALGKIGDQRAIIPLSGALQDKSNNVRKEAAEALGNFF